MTGSDMAAFSTNRNESGIEASIEISPGHALEMEYLETMIPARARVYIVDIGTHSATDIALGCRRLTDLNMIAVLHIAARRLVSHADLEDRVKRYADAGVRDVLVIGGSPKKAEGEITSTMEVLDTGVLDANGIKKIGVASHPEGSPDFNNSVAMAFLELKEQFAKRSDAKMHIVTQFGFDPNKFINWVRKLDIIGVNLPVYPGIAGPAKITTLLKYATMCGVGNSINFLKKRTSILTTLAASFSPESMTTPIESYIRKTLDTTIHGIHVFPFGGVQETSEWLQDRGSWSLSGESIKACNKK